MEFFTLKNSTMQTSRSIKNVMYSFDSRYSDKQDAIKKAKAYQAATGKHAYVVPVNWGEYFDVRTEN